MTRLLCVAPFPPRRDAAHGGGRAVAELLVRLAERNPVALLCLRRQGEPSADEALVERCDVVRELARRTPPRGTLARRSGPLRALARGMPVWADELRAPALHEAIAETAASWRPDVAQIEFEVMGQYADALPPRIPRVVVVHEPGSVRAKDRPRPGLLWRAIGAVDRSSWRRFEPHVLASADAIVVFTERDAATVAPLAAGAELHRIPLGLETSGPPLDPVGREQAVVFVGSFVHGPNVEAAAFLVREILPRVRRRHPEARAYVVGDAPPDSVSRLSRDGVVVTGRVPAVAPYLDRAAVVVAPLRSGGGMRVKVLEALAAGKALVATPLAVSGLPVEDGVHALVRERADAFADAVSELLASPERRGGLGRAARAWAEAQPGWDDVARRYEALYASLLRRD